ncbi:MULTISPECIES: acetate/propionate family kinase [Falsihalocynthiibacter]|uniref:acetate/propionate family kinase n=1 Tax=Falsihalocynthiibacter TaxID=2854182 RepID=UPI0030016EC4
MKAVLALNAGSSTLKFSLYRALKEPKLILSGMVDNIAGAAELILNRGGKKTNTPVQAATPQSALDAVLSGLSSDFAKLDIVAVGHRIVHGGTRFGAPEILTLETMEALGDLTPLAPLHQPFNLAGVRVAQIAFPSAIQIGCFDTAFHREHPWVNDTFALPREFYDQGIRRYGFHGLSYEFVTEELMRRYPDLKDKRIIIAHLGNGASMCAIKNGKSRASSMGFSALDGLPMGTRCGQIDPGVILHLIEQRGMTPQEVTHLLYHQSGMKGLSGISGDMRKLLASDASAAKEALDYYVFRARREIGALTAVLEGLDAFVFCGGVGENSAVLRQRITSGLGYLGLFVDPIRNARNSSQIGTGPVQVLTIPTDEEYVIARAAVQSLNSL